MSKQPSTPNSAGHTPGPWSVRQSLADLTYTHVGSAANNSVACTKSEADAYLIAAAPDLLAALEKLISDPACYSDHMQQARVAVKNARGQ